MTGNLYKVTVGSPSSKSNSANPRWAALALSIGYAVVGLASGWQILVLFAFCTMVAPQFVGRERARKIADQFLFGDGRFQIVLVSILLFLTTTGLISAVLLLVSAIAGQPTLKMVTLISCSAGAFITVCTIGFLMML